MKFAKELDRDLVPEWRLKYLDYKTGKKKLKAIKKAIRSVNQTPRSRRPNGNSFTPSPFDNAPQYSFLNRPLARRDLSNGNGSGDLRHVAMNNSQASLNSKGHKGRSSLPQQIRRSPEEQPLNGGNRPGLPGLTRYGSIIGSPPTNDSRNRAPPSLKLPGAALDPDSSPLPGPSTDAQNDQSSTQLPPATESAFEVGKTRSPHRSSSSLPSRYQSVFSPKRINSTPGVPQVSTSRPLAKRILSLGGNKFNSPEVRGDVPLEAYRDLDIRQAEFFGFLDLELEKIETFYREKEEDATERLNTLREQLHIMRDRRLDELITVQTAKMKAKQARKKGAQKETKRLLNGHSSSSDEEVKKPNSKGNTLNVSWLNPIDTALEAVRNGRYGKTTQAMNELATPNALRPLNPDDDRDYTRRPDTPDVPHATAKRKLKIALQEYYRGLELLKSYALLNRTAFRKINKKYDKTVNARPSMRYMTEKVNKAWFVQSDVIDGHIRVVEDLYARYFERGNHKVAVGKLRVKMARAGDYTENSFRNGLFLAAGLILSIQGIVNGAQLLYSNDQSVASDTGYLFQIYAGVFLMNLLFFLFCMACRVWHENKINYVFVFEYDTRHHLDWRQLSELPCFYFFLLGFFMWLNFHRFGGDTLYTYYPVMLIGLLVLVLFLPVPILYHRSRMWLLYSTWRLILAGIYPVEFRDFYLGDMFCSLTYSLGNLEVFFCLYAHDWRNPAQCNSSHSRVLGFITALPGIWRALQCIRRYADTRNIFPHLVNCGKYGATIMYYVTLSIYRIDRSPQTHAVFITFATVNAIYCSIWDVMMDWSLGDPNAKHPYLRKTLGYKQAWMYYVAMVLDPILRFNWVCYAIYPPGLQHSAILSFFVALTEIFRRGMWTIFRVENEHCTNVGRFRASRDVPLPYDIPSPDIPARTTEEQQAISNEIGSLRRTSTAPMSGMLQPGSQAHTSSANLEPHRTPSSARLRHHPSIQAPPDSPMQRGLARMGSLMRDAHAQDFERRKKPELGREQSQGKAGMESDSDSDDEDGDDDRSVTATEEEVEEEEREEEREEVELIRREVAFGMGGEEVAEDDEAEENEVGPRGEERV